MLDLAAVARERLRDGPRLGRRAHRADRRRPVIARAAWAWTSTRSWSTARTLRRSKLGVADRVQFLKQDVQIADIKPRDGADALPAAGHDDRAAAQVPEGAAARHAHRLARLRPRETGSPTAPSRSRRRRSTTSPGPGPPTCTCGSCRRPVHGAWQGNLPGASGGSLRLEFNQAFQRVEGKVTRNGRTVALKDGQIDGARVRFMPCRGQAAAAKPSRRP